MALNRIDPAHDWLRQRLEGVSVRQIARAAGVSPQHVLEATSKARRLSGKATKPGKRVFAVSPLFEQRERA